MRAYFDSFQSLPTVNSKTTYEELKANVLRVGRFSVFEASANKRAEKLFTQLCKDPEVRTVNRGYPWVSVYRKSKQEESK